MQRALAPLALHPQISISLLLQAQFGLPLYVYVLLLGLAAGAYAVIGVRELVLAAEARLSYNCEFFQLVEGGNLRLVLNTGVVTY